MRDFNNNNRPMTPEEYRAQRLAQYTQRPAQYNPFDMQTMNNESLTGLQQDAMTPPLKNSMQGMNDEFLTGLQQDAMTPTYSQAFNPINNSPGLDNNQLLTSLQDEAMAPYSPPPKSPPKSPSQISGHPALEAAGSAMKVFGAFQEEEQRKNDAHQEQLRYNTGQAIGRVQRKQQMGQQRESHNLTMENAEIARRRAEEDRYLQMANYKGRH